MTGGAGSVTGGAGSVTGGATGVPSEAPWVSAAIVAPAGPALSAWALPARTSAPSSAKMTGLRQRRPLETIRVEGF